MMNNVEKYLGFIEGSLDPKSESEFLAQMAKDKEFNLGFKRYLNLTKSLESSAIHFAPSITTKNAVFSAIGFRGDFDNIPESIPVGKKILNNKSFIIIASSIITFLLTYSGMKYFGNDVQYNIEPAQNGFNNANSSLQYNSFSNLKNETPVSANNVIKMDKAETSPNNIPDSQNEIKDSVEINDVKLVVENSPIVSSIRPVNTQILPAENSKFKINDIDSNNLALGLKFEFANTPSWYSTNPNIQPYQTNKFNNLSLSLLYPINNELAISANFRQETFFLHYSGVDYLNQDADYYQHPNLSSYSLGLRYYPMKSKKFSPFVQADFGLNVAGLITREKIGVEFRLIDDFYFIAAGELNQLYFEHDSKKYSANKYSIIYGLGVSF